MDSLAVVLNSHEKHGNISDNDLEDIPLVRARSSKDASASYLVPATPRPPSGPSVKSLNLNSSDKFEGISGLSRLQEIAADPLTSLKVSTQAQHLKLPGSPNEKLACPPLTSRGLKPPRLNLPDPATASPVSSPAYGKSFTPLPTTERLSVELLTTAFTLPLSACRTFEKGFKAAVQQRFVTSLGVAAEELRVFELRELTPEEDLPVTARHVGVLVNNSSFSLSALEDLIGQNQQLLATVEKNSALLESLHRDCKDAAAERARSTTRVGEKDMEMARLHERCISLERESLELRQQLANSEAQRHKLHTTLAGIRGEFEVLRRQAERASLLVPPGVMTNSHTNSTGTETGVKGSLASISSSILNRNGTQALPNTDLTAELMRIFSQLQIGQLDELEVVLAGNAAKR